METAEIIRQLQTWTGKFPHDAIEAAVAQREEVTPELLYLLEDTADRAAELSASHDNMAPLYAMLLLAQFRETRAYPLVLRIASFPTEITDSILGDFAPQCLGRVLASVCGGDVEGIQALIENEDIDQWVRGSALDSLVTLVAAGEKSREQIVLYFASLFRGKLEREWSHVWDKLVSCCIDIYPAELLEDIERAYESGLVDPGFVDFPHVKRELALGKDRVLAILADDPQYRLIKDTVKEMEWWDCFQDQAEESEFQPTPNVMPAPTPRTRVVNPSRALAIPPMPKVTQVKYATPKTGRNDPCPCGSGKKHKKCCGA